MFKYKLAMRWLGMFRENRQFIRLLTITLIVWASTAPHQAWGTSFKGEAEALFESILNFGAKAGKWELKNATAASAKLLAKHLRSTIPGRSPEFAHFLDGSDYFAAIQKMERAWGSRGQELPFVRDLDAYLSSKSGKTIIVIGHIERNEFVFAERAGAPRINLEALQTKAMEHNVFLIPIGCKSDKAGAFIGTTKNISSDAVADVLSSVPRNGPTLNDFLASFEALGRLTMDVDLSNRMLSFAIQSPTRGLTSSFRVPTAALEKRLFPEVGVREVLTHPIDTTLSLLDWLSGSLTIFASVLSGLLAYLGALHLLAKHIRVPNRLSIIIYVVPLVVALALALSLIFKVHVLYLEFKWSFQNDPSNLLAGDGPVPLSYWVKWAVADHYLELVAIGAAIFYVAALCMLLGRRSLSGLVRRDKGGILRALKACEAASIVSSGCFAYLCALAVYFDREGTIWWSLGWPPVVASAAWFYEQMRSRVGQNASTFENDEESVAR